MAVGDSGRIVIEVDPKFKKKLYKVLTLNETNLKEWFVKQAEDYVQNSQQIKIFEK